MELMPQYLRLTLDAAHSRIRVHPMGQHQWRRRGRLLVMMKVQFQETVLAQVRMENISGVLFGQFLGLQIMKMVPQPIT